MARSSRPDPGRPELGVRKDFAVWRVGRPGSFEALRPSRFKRLEKLNVTHLQRLAKTRVRVHSFRFKYRRDTTSRARRRAPLMAGFQHDPFPGGGIEKCKISLPPAPDSAGKGVRNEWHSEIP